MMHHLSVPTSGLVLEKSCHRFICIKMSQSMHWKIRNWDTMFHTTMGSTLQGGQHYNGVYTANDLAVLNFVNYQTSRDLSVFSLFFFGGGQSSPISGPIRFAINCPNPI